MTILVLEDKLGITEAYMGSFESLALKAGLNTQHMVIASIWKTVLGRKLPLLIRKGNRVSPGFNPDPEISEAVLRWVTDLVIQTKATAILCMDVALLGIVERSWQIATIDNLRGGVYPFRHSSLPRAIPFLVTVPISAINTQKKQKDIRAMNEGYESKSEWEEDHDEDDEEAGRFFIEPYSIPYGKWVLSSDLRKLQRLVESGYRYTTPALRLVMGRSDALEAREFLMESTLISNDIETIPEMKLMSVNGYSGLLPSGEIRTYVFPFYADKSPSSGTPIDLALYMKIMTEVNASGIPFTYQNGAYDLFWLVRYGMPVKNYAYDSMTMFWSLYPELPKRLDFISSVLLDDYVYWKGDRKSDDQITYLEYNGKDCDRTLRDTCALVDILSTDDRARQNFHDAHLRVLLALGMSLRGMRVDEERLAYHGANLTVEADAALERLRYLVADGDFNPNSPKQKLELLYLKLGARKRNAKGRFVNKIEDASTGAVPMRSMRSEHPIFRRVVNGIMEANEPAKQISNVIGIRRAPWGRVYTSYNAVRTTTSRFGSSESPITYGTNFQNIRKTYRDWMVAEPGHFLIDIDLSAGDDVFVTYESADPKKIALHRTGRDSHSENATLFFPDWNYDDIVAGKRASDPRIVHPITGIRQITKKLSHGCNYLMAELTLLMTTGREAIVAAAKELGNEDAGIWTQEQLAQFCLTRELLYRNHYTRFQREGEHSWYTDLQKEFAATDGFTTPFNYFQRFLGDKRDQNVLRALAATAGQAGTAGRINDVMVELTHGIIRPNFRDAENPHRYHEPRKISRDSHGISMRLQTHDSLTWDVNPEHPRWEEGIMQIFEVMSRPTVIQNKLTGDFEVFVVGTEAEVGLAWGKGLHEIKKPTIEAVKKALPWNMRLDISEIESRQSIQLALQ